MHTNTPIYTQRDTETHSYIDTETHPDTDVHTHIHTKRHSQTCTLRDINRHTTHGTQAGRHINGINTDSQTCTHHK